MSVLAIILIVLAAIVVVLFIGGWIVEGRRRRATAAGLADRVATADRALAAAAATDRGWSRSVLEGAVRSAWEQRGGAPIDLITLVAVLDRPGTDEDEAVFVVTAGRKDTEIRLGRRGDVWSAA